MRTQIKFMFRMFLTMIVTTLTFLTTRSAKADDPQYIALSYDGWNEMITGEDYWTTPQYARNWSLEIYVGHYEGVYGQGGHFAYGPAQGDTYYYPAAVLYKGSGGWFEFTDMRIHPNYAPADKVMLLFKSYGVPLTIPNGAPRPQGFFEVSEYGFGSWHCVIRNPEGTTWAIYVSAHNEKRADEMDVWCVAQGYEEDRDSVGNVVMYQGNAQ